MTTIAGSLFYLDELRSVFPGLLDIADRDGVASTGSAVDRPGPLWLARAPDWLLVHDVLGGTRSLRDAGQRRLPKFQRERQTAYESRLAESFAAGFFPDALEDLVARPFSRPVTFSQEPPEWLAELHRDLDGRGTTFQSFAGSLFASGLTWGDAYVHVETPLSAAASDALREGRRPTVGELGNAKRPTVRIVPGPNLLGALRNADGTYQRVRYYRREVVDDVDAEEVPLEVVREFVTLVEPDRIVEWSRSMSYGSSTKDEWQRDERTNPAGRVVFVDWIPKGDRALMAAKPALLELAHVEVDYWQSYSDQRQILHVGRLPFLYETGVAPDHVNRELVIGPRRAHRTTKSATDASLTYVEPTGSAIQSGERHLEALIARAKDRQDEPLKTNGPKTATGEIRADEGQRCLLQKWANKFEGVLDAVQRALAEAHPMPGAALPPEYRTKVFTEFDLSSRFASDMQVVTADRTRGDISHETYLGEAKRRGVYPEELDIEEEIERTKKEREARVAELEAEMERTGQLGAEEEDDAEDEGAADEA